MLTIWEYAAGGGRYKTCVGSKGRMQVGVKTLGKATGGGGEGRGNVDKVGVNMENGGRGAEGKGGGDTNWVSRRASGG